MVNRVGEDALVALITNLHVRRHGPHVVVLQTTTKLLG